MNFDTTIPRAYLEEGNNQRLCHYVHHLLKTIQMNQTLAHSLYGKVLQYPFLSRSGQEKRKMIQGLLLVRCISGPL